MGIPKTCIIGGQSLSWWLFIRSLLRLFNLNYNLSLWMLLNKWPFSLFDSFWTILCRFKKLCSGLKHLNNWLSSLSLISPKLMIRSCGNSFFVAMERVGTNKQFLSWIKMLVANASAAVNLNGSTCDIFPIERVVRQGCPLAPYLFLIVGEFLYHITKHVMANDRINAVTHPWRHDQQCILHYIDDPSFLIREDNKVVDEMVRLLHMFNKVPWMEINLKESKSCAY